MLRYSQLILCDLFCDHPKSTKEIPCTKGDLQKPFLFALITFCAASLFATGGSDPPETLDDLCDARRTLRAEYEDPAYILMDEGLSPDMTTAMEEFTEADHCISGYKRDLQKAGLDQASG